MPCRSGSERVPNKNLRSFAGSTLLRIKLDQLFRMNQLNKVIVSTDDPAVFDACKGITDPRLEIHERDSYYCSSSTTTDELVKYFAKVLDFEQLLWTHVTSPFADDTVYSRAIDLYEDGLLKGFDSVVGVEKVQEFVWRPDFTPVNYSFEKDGVWPRTQTIKPVYIVNSALFIISHEMMKRQSNRVGVNPKFFEMNHLESFDIDWEADFKMAEVIWNATR